MKFEQWDNRFKTLKSSTNLLIILNLILAIMLLSSLWANFQKKPIIVVQPLIANQSLEVRANELTKSYAVSFGLSMALLLGNVTSDNAGFVVESVSNYVSPQYFARFRKQLVADIEKLKANRMDMTFTATHSYYDKTTNEVVIEGVSSIVDAVGQRLNSVHQYRFRLDMNDYVPRITEIKSIDIKN